MNAEIIAANSRTANLSRLPAIVKRQIDSTDLTPLYLQAREALARVVDIDEVKDIADKYSAVAHYARQAKDTSLRYMAERIYLRSLRRIGEILEELPQGLLGDAKKRYGITGSDSSHARAIASIPSEVFEQKVEQTPPPTKNGLSWELRQKNIRHDHKHERKQTPGQKAKNLQEAIESLRCLIANGYCGWVQRPSDVDSIAPLLAAEIRIHLRPLLNYLDELDTRLAHREKQK